MSEDVKGISPERKLKIAVCGAHPDDPETGCGGTMALYSELGHEVVAVYLTRGEAGIDGMSHDEAAAIRTKEALEACKILNARAVFVGQIDGKCEINAVRYAEFRKIIEDENPDIIFTHWAIDSHPDHRVCSHLAYDAWMRSGRRAALYYYEVMTGSQTQNFHPTDYVDITGTLEKKHRASFVHVSQGIESVYARTHGRMETFRGMEYGCKAAEAYVKHARSRAAVLP
jgi:LmbE family N-acetylglucosaminyl deacetylase